MNAVATASPSRTHWMHNYIWLIKRELWEHRGGLLITPLVIGTIIILGVLYALLGPAEFGGAHVKIGGLGGFTSSGLDAAPAITHAAQFAMYFAFSIPFIIVMSIVTTYYALDALYADRRDRSVLFWKSLPVSDLETVLSKLAIALLIAPVIAMVVSLATQLFVFIAVSIALAAHGHAVAPLWQQIPVIENLTVVLYALVIQAFWYFPILAWCLLASAWAQRAVFLWATVPIGVLWFLERMTIGSNHIGELLKVRLAGGFSLAMTMPREVMEHSGITVTDSAAPVLQSSHVVASIHLSDVLTPGVFFSSAQVWIGLLVGAGFIVATVWLRRYREAT